MRILCSTPPIEGVFGPFIPLGRALMEAGHELIVASGSDLRTRAEENGLRLEVVGLTAMEGAMAAFADEQVKAAPAGDRHRFPAAMFGLVIPEAQMPALSALADELQPDLIVHPPVGVAGALLAAERGVPSACYGFAQPFDSAVLSAIARRSAGMWEQAGLEPDPWAGVYRGLYIDPCPPSLGGQQGITAAAGVQAIQPEIPGDPTAPLPDWADGLEGRPVVYVSLGTAPLFNQPAKFSPLLTGLAGEELEVVVTVSELHDPAALGELPPSVHAEQWLPLAPLLPRCDAVICHGGTGTTLAALVAGLPLVLVPQGADQFDNARACERAGAARVLNPDNVTPDAVRDAVRAVQADGSPERAAAQAIAREIAAMPSAAQLARELQTIANTA